MIGGVFRLFARQSAPAPLAYPERLGRWPAVVGIVAFGWLELVYGQAGFQTVGLTPHTTAVATLAYTAYTFVAMTLFGSEKWLARGEAFSVYFGMFSTLAPLEVRERQARPPAGPVRGDEVGRRGAGLGRAGAGDDRDHDLRRRGGGDARRARPHRGRLGRGHRLRRRGGDADLELDLPRTHPCLIAGLFWAGIYGMHTVRTQFSTRQLGRLFGHAFIPIALAYLVAHYFSLVVFQEQAQFTFLLSDPLGDGSDLFGTATSGIDYTAISSNAIWYVQVGTLVAGHVTALVLGHDRALKVYGDARTAARSQYWMLALMVGFTSLGLFLLSQANA